MRSIAARKTGTVLAVHGDGDLLDMLAWLFEARDLEVHVAATARSALARIELYDYDLVVTGWELPGEPGIDLYVKAVAAKPALRTRFVFLHEGEPPSIAGVIDHHCPFVSPTSREELVRLAEGGSRRMKRITEADLAEEELEFLEESKPRVLLVEDEALQLMTMVSILTDVGFQVTPADSGNAAMARLTVGEFDVILSDWYMEDGTGGDLCVWIDKHRPRMSRRIVFMSGTAPPEFEHQAAGRTLLPKGQDSHALIDVLLRVVKG